MLGSIVSSKSFGHTFGIRERTSESFDSVNCQQRVPQKSLAGETKDVGSRTIVAVQLRMFPYLGPYLQDRCPSHILHWFLRGTG